MAWYSGVSGCSSARKGLPGSKERPNRNVFGTAPNRRHWPFRSGYFESSKAAAEPIDIMSADASVVPQIELRKRMGSSFCALRTCCFWKANTGPEHEDMIRQVSQKVAMGFAG